MFFYIALICLLIPFYLLDVTLGAKSKTQGFSIIFAFIYFVFIAGLRDSTGYDWFVYRTIFEGVNTASSLSEALEIGYQNGSEVGLTVLIYLLTVLGTGFWFLQVLVSLLNVYSFIRLNNYLGGGAVKGLLIYGCWLFLVLQMGVLRMSISLSFLSLGVIYLLERKRVKLALCVLLACLFHVFSMMLSVVMIAASLNIPKKIIALVLLVLSGLYLAGVNIIDVVLSPLTPYMPNFIAVKVDLYLKIGDLYQRSASEFLYKFFMGGLFGFVLFNIDWNNRVERYLLNLSFIYIVFLLLFWKYPIFHDRLKYLALMPFFYLVFMVIDKKGVFDRCVYGMAFLCMSLAVYLHEVSGEGFYPYTPYFNVYERWLGGEDNDGEARTLKYYRDFSSDMGLGG
ncbi:EpsG family protein [Pseudomonas sp. NA-150]|uniref:EpsG family protein n=1 Tax=Pseudomonas sp. NA-150 TaxID=3367525 RepID=UPI0037CB8AB1